MDIKVDIKGITKNTHAPIYLWENGQIPRWDESLGQCAPSLIPYLLPDSPDSGIVIVFPGGGYTQKVAHEGEPIALRFNELGYNVFILDYRILPYKFPVPLLDAQRAIRTVRRVAPQMGLRSDKIALAGFSAGGHLALMSAAHYDLGDISAQDETERFSCRPDAAVLVYTSLMSRRINDICGDDYDRHNFNVQNWFDQNTPPMFIAHTAQDEKVPVENALTTAQQLATRGIPVALHVYPYGKHGMAMGDTPGKENFQGRHWGEDCQRFLDELGF